MKCPHQGHHREADEREEHGRHDGAAALTAPPAGRRILHLVAATGNGAVRQTIWSSARLLRPLDDY